MRIAVIGGGVSGLVAAHTLSEDHEVTVFEAQDSLGGHTHTIDVRTDSETRAVDTGFMVFNQRTYPNFCQLMDRLGVESQASDMSFSLQCDATGLQYNGTSLSKMFVQRRNLFNHRFLRMLKDIIRFNRAAPAVLSGPQTVRTVGEYVTANGYSEDFFRWYLVPVSASIWSSVPRRIEDFPILFFVQFMHNHGMLSVNDRPEWRVIKGGSRNYIDPLTRSFRQGIRLACPVDSVRRFADRVEVKPRSQPWETFDWVVMAAHSNQALSVLEDGSPEEREILGALPFQSNDVVLHTDRSLLPSRRRAWASWNYHLLDREDRGVALTYHMNRLQSLDATEELCVTLNRPDDIAPQKVLERLVFDHPIFTVEGVEAQRRHGEISGVRRTSYCGAYWGFGFHEDGVRSAIEACTQLRGRSQVA